MRNPAYQSPRVHESTRYGLRVMVHNYSWGTLFYFVGEHPYQKECECKKCHDHKHKSDVPAGTGLSNKYAPPADWPGQGRV